MTSTIPSCTGKFPFPTRELAEASAVRMRKRKSQHQAAQTYRCHQCGKWHIAAAADVGGRVSNATLPATRAEATERGAVRYFNGEPCPSGHVAPRYTLGGYCVECQRQASRAQKAAVKTRRGAR